MKIFGFDIGALFARPAPLEVVPAPRQYSVTLDQLRRIMPLSRGRVDVYIDHLNRAMAEFEINTKDRVAAFLAQLAHESGEFKYTEEIASGDAYEGRLALGNTEPGDGRRFKGRGPIQTTGRKNVTLASRALFGDDRLVNNPELLEEPETGCRSSAFFWKSNGCNELADRGEFVAITRRINGGTNGLTQRQAYWERAKRVLPQGRT